VGGLLEEGPDAIESMPPEVLVRQSRWQEVAPQRPLRQILKLGVSMLASLTRRRPQRRHASSPSREIVAKWFCKAWRHSGQNALPIAATPLLAFDHLDEVGN
jgi:hypothetical protein